MCATPGFDDPSISITQEVLGCLSDFNILIMYTYIYMAVGQNLEP